MDNDEFSDKEIRLSILRILVSNYGFDLDDVNALYKIDGLAKWVISGNLMYKPNYQEDVKSKEGGQ